MTPSRPNKGDADERLKDRLPFHEYLTLPVELTVTPVGLVRYRDHPLFATYLDVPQVGVLRRVLALQVG